eukprot:7571878-Ditylum_brightwellii.AAC.1
MMCQKFSFAAMIRLAPSQSPPLLARRSPFHVNSPNTRPVLPPVPRHNTTLMLVLPPAPRHTPNKLCSSMPLIQLPLFAIRSLSGFLL